MTTTSKTSDFRIGCHLSASEGYLSMAKTAVQIGANTFQFFTRNPRGGTAKPIDPEDVSAFLEYSEQNDIGPILAHASYTLNLCAAEDRIREFARYTLMDDLFRMEFTPGNLYNLHPGSHVQQGVEKGIELIAEALNAAITEEQTTWVLLETMAGKGTEIGRTFEELRSIIDRVHVKDRLGVCLDTCHVFDAGYDIKGNTDQVLETFDRVIGLDRLKAIHINDTKNPFQSHKDRHETIGNGYLGIETLRKVINHPALRHLPFYLETPNELPGYASEIALLKTERTGA
ncbi:MAG TPA: deoxyribonuclease IV [Bacteroidales bacterium]|jgi:deoxyribonuclease-4|nr:deoxyribonuclease IV [Bacteroidales bacterium]MCZ2416675.1 deoxyribonuclease IV [Burkholderiales bacterium]OQC57471.1 MAG: putative endonuclease 4 [Bacteroidetes bacterium ADurb.Bin013]MBP8999216.1 deoxyribonuclease IV [Bacteroidales bacterium]MBV6455442.1 putative endonuclease 4 [Bacteroidales bacterium]